MRVSAVLWMSISSSITANRNLITLQAWRRPRYVVFSVVHEVLNHTRLMNSHTIKEIAPKHVTSIMISGAFPSYRDASLFSAVMDFMNRFEPGIVPGDEDPMGQLELGRYIKFLVTKERNKILTALKMSITHKTNLWLLADELLPSGYRKVSSILGHLAFLRERVVPWEKKVEDLKQETVRSKRRGKSKKLMIPTFFEFMDEEIKKNY
ncbi:hypothetical protein J007_05906 [Cryptococcus neoformans]|nr:hypothetical protein C356_05989 [Cryptococcus neoformans var. grubii c45]OXB34423.1 hypothetical protein J007_05906 [Cryptococcus neoformans var. grubii]OXC62771.1 hypothetical protein C358_01881 [Cryptococcus neoformans var. grubii MW-RSA852]